MFGMLRRTPGGIARFNPKGNTVRPMGARRRRLIQLIALSVVLSTGMTVVAAKPAFANRLVVSTKAISAPNGARGLCARYKWACDRSAKGRITGADAELSIAKKVNRSVNRKVRSVTDKRQYGVIEYWTLPTSGRGDCEDFVLLKKRELIRLGIAPAKLSIATVLDRRRSAHAVLVLKTDKGDFVLDNLNDRVKPWRSTGYSFLRMQDPRTRSGWTAVMRGGIYPS